MGIGADAPPDTQHLRAALLALKAPRGEQRRPAPRSSVYGRAAAAVPSDVRPPAAADVLAARLASIETSAALPGTALALVVTPVAPLPPTSAARCRRMLDGGATVVALGPGLARQVADAGQPLTLPLRPDDALSQEWALVVCGPQRRLAFLARQRPDGEVWDWLVTQDAVAVQRAATALLERVPFLGLRVPTLAAV